MAAKTTRKARRKPKTRRTPTRARATRRKPDGRRTPTRSSSSRELAKLARFLRRVPAITGAIGTGSASGLWWAKFAIDVQHPLAWHVVQELGHVLNYVSIDERLPTVFMPVSPPPYMNGGPRDFLSWVIESKARDFSPSTCVEWLRGRLPRPVDDLAAWATDDDA